MIEITNKYTIGNGGLCLFNKNIVSKTSNV